MFIQRLLPAVLAASIAHPALAAPEGGISTPMLSRCAGKAGLETRQSDAAFGLLSPRPPRSVPAYHHKQHLSRYPAGQFLRLLVRRRTARPFQQT